MKVYFAGSINGGRQFASSYRTIVDALQALGCSVLSWHIAEPDPTVYEPPSPQAVYRRNVASITDADLVVAEVSQPSIGVGYEVGLALTLRKPTLCLYHASQDMDRLSYMIRGNDEATLSFAQYDEENVIEVVRRFLDSIRSRT